MRVYSYDEAQEAALKLAGSQKKTAYIFENSDGDIWMVVYKNTEKWGDYQLCEYYGWHLAGAVNEDLEVLENF